MRLNVSAAYIFVDWDNGGAFPKDFFLVLDAYAINLGGIGEQLKL